MGVTMDRADDMVLNLEHYIDQLKAHGFEAEQHGAFWFVFGPGYTGLGDTEYLAWCDLLLDVPLADEILERFPSPAPPQP